MAYYAALKRDEVLIQPRQTMKALMLVKPHDCILQKGDLNWHVNYISLKRTYEKKS